LICIALSLASILSLSHSNVLATQSNSTTLLPEDFGMDLKSKINNLVSNALNDTDTFLNSSLLSNGSNLTSSNIIVSSNKVFSIVNTSGSDIDSSSLVKNQIKTSNGECTSIKTGGNGNDTLTSSGNCNDELTGGLGADKFTCGEGDDIIKDFDPKEGDVILDRQNCEKV
jgi:hypothetical protein